MPVIDTSLLVPGEKISQAIYNGLDACITHEVHRELNTLFNQPPQIYNFERGLQGPLLEMMHRGMKIDRLKVAKNLDELYAKVDHLTKVLDALATAVWDKPLNPRSSQQLQTFFYKHMKLPEVWVSIKGERKLAMNREVLEKIERYFHAMPIVATIFALRDCGKKISVLETEIDQDGRMRSSFNIGGTETGRLSSSRSAFGTGTNQQNITEELQDIFIADEGMKMGSVDLEQAESREVGWLCGILCNDWSYLDACYAGDLHTITARLIWPNKEWTGDLKKDRKIAEQNFYRNFSYRDMSKRGGHGSNYYGTAYTMARHLKVPAYIMEAFQEKYLDKAFPGIRGWHAHTARELQTTQTLTTVFGYQRQFFGRPEDDTTLREAIAFRPQSATAHRTNLILYRLWKAFPNPKQFQLLSQVHDAIKFQYDPKMEDEILPEVLRHFHIPITYGDRELKVPGEIKVGWNLRNVSYNEDGSVKANPDGLVKWRPGFVEKRVRTTGFNRIL